MGRAEGEIYGDGEDHWGSFVFGEEVGDGLNELEVEVFYSALVFFDLFWGCSLFDNGSEPSFGDDDGLVVFEDIELLGERFRDVLFVELEEFVGNVKPHCSSINSIRPSGTFPWEGKTTRRSLSSFGVF